MVPISRNVKSVVAKGEYHDGQYEDQMKKILANQLYVELKLSDHNLQID